ncbi:MAG: peptidylprolyl isomerase, partial [Tepidisphaerales bacterium]
MLIGANRRHRVVCRAALESLETRTLLTNTAPVLDPIPAVTMVAPTATTQVPKTIQIPLTATDANGDALTYTVTSSNPNIVPITHAGDPFLKMTVQYEVSEFQTISGDFATAGTYTLSFGGNTTTPIAFDATAADVQTALQLLPGLSGVVVGGNSLSTGGINVTFPASMGAVALLAIDTTNLTPNTGYTVQEHTKGSNVTGDMWLMLYKEWAPITVQNITGFLNAGFYNNLTFHRILQGFMAQGGDPNGDGTGGPGFSFKDEFNPNLIFSNMGQLAMANSGDDTNGSQFFITDAPYRSGDFNYTIWGQLVRGFDIYNGLISNPVQDPTTGTPIIAPKILSASIVPDLTDTAITLSAKKAGNATITVTVNDGHGGTSKQTFQVTATADTENDPAYLYNLTDLYTPMDQPISIPLSGLDLEHDPLSFDAAITDNPAHATLVKNGALITVVPDKGYTGVVHLIAGVNRTINRPNETDTFDKETITISVGGKPIHARPLGFSAVAGAARTAYVTTFTCDDATLDAGSFTATVNWGDGTALTSGDIVKTGSLYVVTGTHTYTNPGEYPQTVTITRTALTEQTGSVTSVRVLAEVAPAPQAGHTATIINAGQPIVARQNVSLWQWGSISSTATTLSATVNWGDGSASAALPLTANRNFRLMHTYTKAGKFNITITANDGSGTPTVQRVPATVLAAGPAAVVSGDKSGITGQNRTFYLRASDAGSNIPAANYWY